MAVPMAENRVSLNEDADAIAAGNEVAHVSSSRQSCTKPCTGEGVRVKVRVKGKG